MKGIRERAVLLGLGRLWAVLQVLSKHKCHEAETDEKPLRMRSAKLFEDDEDFFLIPQCLMPSRG